MPKVFTRLRNGRIKTCRPLVASKKPHLRSLPNRPHHKFERRDCGSPRETQARLDRYAALLRHCANGKSLSKGMSVHGRVIESGLDQNMLLGSLLLYMYGKYGAVAEACTLFSSMRQRNSHSWNFMIRIFAEHGMAKEALQLCKKMQRPPDKFTFVIVLSACVSLASLGNGRKIHLNIQESGCDSDIVVGTALVNMYGKCGSLDDAKSMFDRLPERNVFSWTAVISAHAQHRQSKEALQLFTKMHLEGVMPNAVTFVSVIDACADHMDMAKCKQIHVCILENRFGSGLFIGNAMIHMYSKCGSLEDAERMFASMPEWNVVSWTSMVTAYAQHSQGKKALELFNQMESNGVMPNKVTFVSILDACADVATLMVGEHLHEHIISNEFESDIIVGTALVNMYGKCGRLEDAQKVFEWMSKRNLLSWSAMIAAYAQQGRGKEAVMLFDRMQREGVIPDKVIFVHILSACSHSGLVDEGQHFFISMTRDHGIIPTVDHYSCLIDVFGRAGLLDEAEVLINNIPAQPAVVPWRTMLVACGYQADMERGEHAAKLVFELDPKDSAPFVTLSNIYATADRVHDAAYTGEEFREKIMQEAF